MCGIAGFSGGFEGELLHKMDAAIAYRGPDGNGVFQDKPSGIGLAHRRLAIIDLSETGIQPMSDVSNKATIVFNGEIYNYKELRKGLVGKGYVFNGDSDTEVLINLYLAYGSEMLSRLNGIFSFAIWDKAKKELFIARDGVGVKPLYYSETSKGFIFASEIKALLQENTVSRELDASVIARHLTFLWSPSPDTILRNVKKFNPGTAMIISQGKIVKQWQFYDLPFGVKKHSESTVQTCEQLRHHLDQAVERQMVADVPVGAFLSGGLDSSSVVASARKFSPQKLQCFTIAFNDKKASEYEGMTEDYPYAQKVAKHLDVDLHTIEVGPEMIDSLEELIYYLDEPLADPAPLNAFFISKLANENGIKVLLSGAGGDDIFTGYRRHYALSVEHYWSWLPQSIRSVMSKSTAHLPVNTPLTRRVRKAFEYAGQDSDERIASYFYWSQPALATQLLSPDFRRNIDENMVIDPLISAMKTLPDSASRMDKMLFLECKYFLADHNLNYTDRTSMAHGVEVRVPLLDPDLINFAAGVPDKLKQNGRTGKWIFKKAMEGILPDEIIYRPKTGFGAPLRYWLRGTLRPLVEDLLGEKSIKDRGIFNSHTVANLIKRDMKGDIDASYTIFAMICIEMWCRTFIDKNPTFPKRTHLHGSK